MLLNKLSNSSPLNLLLTMNVIPYCLLRLNLSIKHFTLALGGITILQLHSKS